LGIEHRYPAPMLDLPNIFRNKSNILSLGG